MIKKENSFKGTAVRVLIFIAILCFVAGLLTFAYMGSFIRLIGDDYCYAGVEEKYGFFGGQVESYFHEVPYHGDRFTLTLVSFLISLFPPEVNGWIPLATIILFCLANFFLIQSLVRYLNGQLSVMVTILISVVVAFFTLLLAPTVNQSLYFRSAMLPSFAPIIFTIFLAGWLLWVKKIKWHHYLLVFLAALLNSALSENGAAFQAMALGILLLYFIRQQLKPVARAWTRTILTFLALAGTAISVLIMWLSPSIVDMLNTANTTLWDSIGLSLIHSFDYYMGFFKAQYLVVIVLLLTGGLAALVKRTSDKTSNQPKTRYGLKNFIIILDIQLISMLLIFSLMLPSAYTRNAYPDPRHLIGATLVMTANIFFIGFSLAETSITFLEKLNLHFSFIVKISAGVLLILVGIFYPVRYIPHITREYLLFQYWSKQWELRNDEIIAAMHSGMDLVHVMRLDHIIEDVGELGSDPQTNWYNQCAALYYGIEIYADQPGWEEGLKEFVDPLN